MKVIGFLAHCSRGRESWVPCTPSCLGLVRYQREGAFVWLSEENAGARGTTVKCKRSGRKVGTDFLGLFRRNIVVEFNDSWTAARPDLGEAMDCSLVAQ